MKVKELIKELQALDPELKIYVKATHGDTPQPSCGAYECYLRSDDDDEPYFMDDDDHMPVEMDEGESYQNEWLFDGTNEEAKKLPRFVMIG